MMDGRRFGFDRGIGVEAAEERRTTRTEYVEVEDEKPRYGVEPRTHTVPSPAQLQEGFTTVATLIGRKWHLVILDQLLTAGPLGFSALLRRIDGISSKVLSESLTDLEKNGFISRSVVSDRPFRVEYAMTNRGYSLRPVLDAVHVGFDDDNDR